MSDSTKAISTATCAHTAYVRPRVHFTDHTPGRPCAKDPAVVRFGGRYWLYYSVPPERSPGRWRLGIAVSDDLLDWKIVGNVSFDDGAESLGIAAPGAMVIDGRVHLFYQTYGYGPADAICHAVSDDGLHFHRSENPIFRPTGAWTCGRAIDADVVRFGDRLLLYYATRDPQMHIQMLGVASAKFDVDFGPAAWTHLSTDGPVLRPRVLTSLDDADLDLAWEGDCIEAAATTVRNGRVYLFYGGGYNNAPQQVGLAVSDDGVHFRRLNRGQPVVPVGMPGTWNDRESGHPYYFDDERGQGWLFYQGNNAAESAAADRDTWYLSVLRAEWPSDGDDCPRFFEP